MGTNPISEFGLACPSGGDFYICQGNTTQFIGCCTTDPCSDGKGSCPQANLETATFNKLDYEAIGEQSCSSSKAEWYACSALSTPFMGCCTSNACSNTSGCPTADLVAAELGNATEAKVFMTTTVSSAIASKTTASKTSTSLTSVLSSATSAASSAAATTGAAAASDSSASSGLSPGAKAGIGIGAVALIALVGVLFFIIKRTLGKRSGVVVRGSEPPTLSMMSYTPMRGFADSNQITYAPQPLSSASNTPLRPSLPAKWPSTTYERSYSAGSSPSMGFISRETSVRSAISNNVLGIMPGSPADAEAGRRPQYHQYGGSQSGHAGLPLDMLAELDGGEAFPSPPISEMAAPTPTASSRLPFRPYTPSR